MNLPPLPEESIKWVLADRAYSFMTLATATCVVYDHITTLDDEWSIVQLLFFINRYIGDVSQIFGAVAIGHHFLARTSKHCNFINIFMGYAMCVTSFSMQGIMIFRVSSMYNHDRWIMSVLGVGFMLQCIAVVIVQVLSYGVHVPIPSPAPGVFPCEQDSFPRWMYSLWMPPFIYEGLILLLSLLRALDYYRSEKDARQHDLRSSALGLQTNSLAYILLRDSIAFPSITVSVCLLNLFIFAYLPHLATQMAFCIAGFVPCITGSRLILNLRDAYYRPFQEEVVAGNIHGGGAHEALELQQEWTSSSDTSGLNPS